MRVDYPRLISRGLWLLWFVVFLMFVFLLTKEIQPKEIKSCYGPEHTQSALTACYEYNGTPMYSQSKEGLVVVECKGAHK